MDFLTVIAADISLETLKEKTAKMKNSVIGTMKNGKTVLRMCSVVNLVLSLSESFFNANTFIETFYQKIILKQ